MIFKRPSLLSSTPWDHRVFRRVSGQRKSPTPWPGRMLEAALTTSPVCDRHHRIPDRLRIRVGSMQTHDTQQQSWRDRAREIRALGDQMHDRLAKDEMLRLANKYERLADWTEEQARHSSAIP